MKTLFIALFFIPQLAFATCQTFEVIKEKGDLSLAWNKTCPGVEETLLLKGPKGLKAEVIGQFYLRKAAKILKELKTERPEHQLLIELFEKRSRQRDPYIFGTNILPLKNLPAKGWLSLDMELDKKNMMSLKIRKRFKKN